MFTSSIKDIPKFPNCNYKITVNWIDINNQFINSDKILELNPEYQRGYVWSQNQKQDYIEYKLKGGLGANIIYWNYPNLKNDIGTSEWYNTYELVDDKQRLNAVLEFLNDKVKVFGKYLSEFEDAKIAMKRQSYYFEFHINQLTTKKEVVEWYLGLNRGGTVHKAKDLKIAEKYFNEYQNKN